MFTDGIRPILISFLSDVKVKNRVVVNWSSGFMGDHLQTSADKGVYVPVNEVRNFRQPSTDYGYCLTYSHHTWQVIRLGKKSQ